MLKCALFFLKKSDFLLINTLQNVNKFINLLASNSKCHVGRVFWTKMSLQRKSRNEITQRFLYPSKLTYEVYDAENSFSGSVIGTEGDR